MLYKLIFEENDERYYVAISKSITDTYVEVHCESSTTSETLLIDANNPEGEAIVFLKRESGHLYEIDHHETGFYITTNKDAKNNKVVFHSLKYLFCLVFLQKIKIRKTLLFGESLVLITSSVVEILFK